MTYSQPLTDLLDRWRKEIADLRSMYFDEGRAALTARHLTELENALNLQSNELLTLAEASRLSGYTEDHLGRLVRDGKIANAGREHVPRIRRADVPLKASRLRNSDTPLQYARADSPRQIARSIVTSNQ
jgi:hypothetical protein